MRKFSEKAAESAITPIRGTTIQDDFQSCTLFYPITKWLSNDSSEFRSFFNKRGMRLQAESFAIQIQEEEGLQLANKSTTEWNFVIVTNPSFNTGQMSLIKELVRQGKKVAVIGGAFPYDQFPAEVKNLVSAYWTWPAAVKAAVLGLLGERKMKGRLPFR